jgi:tripartite-type tricarboxylate transporter receptor subunit TctC
MTFSGTSRRRALKLGLAASLAAPAVARAQVWPSGPVAGGETPDQFAQRIRAEIEKWQKVVAAADVRID